MAKLDNRWLRYNRWNKAIAEAVYPASVGGLPVYLDLEEDVLEKIRDLAEPEAADPETALVSAAKETFDFAHGATKLWQRHLNLLDVWKIKPRNLSPPPTLVLLAVLSLAAEKMHKGEGMGSQNYYDRLGELLKITNADLNLVKSAYGQKNKRNKIPVAELLWASLNDWLEDHDGNHGLPTAMATTHRHIGFPLSQALVRGTDRDKFEKMFISFGLAPRGSLSPIEIKQLLGKWISIKPCPVSKNLEIMWSKGSLTQDRIVDVARLCLESWDGSGSEAIDGPSALPKQSDLVRIMAQVKQSPPPCLEISFILPTRTEKEIESFEVLDQDGSVVDTLDLFKAGSGWLTPADPAEIDSRSLLEGLVSLKHSDRPPLRRRPRRLIPLCYDDLFQAYVETERVQLGEDHILLSRVEISSDVEELLNLTARPGFTRLKKFRGLPEGWVLFRGVQILSSIPESVLPNDLDDLNMLQPLAVSQSGFQDGMRIPGNIRKWSTSRPPELRVSSESGSTIRAELEVTKPLANQPLETRTCDVKDSVLLWDLATEQLLDGDYQVTVFEDKEKRPRATVILRLRSADSPSVLLDDGSHPLEHVSNSPLFGFAPEAGVGDSAKFCCVPTTGDETLNAVPDSRVPSWYLNRQRPVKQPRVVEVVTFPEFGKNSCIKTGAHYMLLEMAEQGMNTVEGVCKECGLVKRFPTKGQPKKVSSASHQQDAAPRIKVQGLAKVRQPGSINWKIGFDVVCHVGRGPISALEGIARQMEFGNLFGDIFARRMDELGHIEIDRHASSLRPRVWQINDPVLAGLPRGDILLLGFRNEKLMAALRNFVCTNGAQLLEDERVPCPPVVRISGFDLTKINDLVAVVSGASSRPTVWAPHASEHLASRLPSLSRLIGSLPKTGAIGAKNYERWNPEIARFERCTDTAKKGAYRLSGFARAYIYRSTDQLGSMVATLGDARLVKYAAALDERRWLVGYDKASKALYVPLGADLPGLYGRAAVLASGYPPDENLDEEILQYRDVPPPIAAHIIKQLSS